MTVKIHVNYVLINNLRQYNNTRILYYEIICYFIGRVLGNVCQLGRPHPLFNIYIYYNMLTKRMAICAYLQTHNNIIIQ